ncbi:MAG: pantetheine-phosphate adenylyltransferase [Sphingobacteriia bacterium]|nr:pantetheine-phosphate adenylyltransferase [Sphingobacteriia bacterium]
MQRIGIYAGTFDPMTIGHANILKRALNVVDELVIAVAVENYKDTLFTAEERVDMVEHYIKEIVPNELHRIKVSSFKGLLVHFAKDLGASLLVRGIRAVPDFEYEFQLACVNSRLMPSIETIFIPASENNQYVSSRFVKEVARLGGDASSFSCNYIVKKLNNYYAKLKEPPVQQLND